MPTTALGYGLRMTGFREVAASAMRHVGWWLRWHTRAHPGEGCRELLDPRCAS